MFRELAWQLFRMPYGRMVHRALFALPGSKGVLATGSDHNMSATSLVVLSQHPLTTCLYYLKCSCWNISTYVRMYIQIYIHACMHACMNAYIRIYTYIHTRTHLHIFIYTYRHVETHTYRHVSIYTYIHIYIYTYIHILEQGMQTVHAYTCLHTRILPHLRWHGILHGHRKMTAVMVDPTGLNQPMVAEHQPKGVHILPV